MLTLINLDTAHDRRERMAEQLDALGVPYARVGIDLRRTSNAAVDAWLARHLPGIGFDRNELSGAEIGCWVSHVTAWKRLAASDAHAATVGAIYNTWDYTIACSYVQRFFAQARTIAIPIDHWLGGRSRLLQPRIAVLRSAMVAENPALGLDSQIEPHTMRIDRWKIVEGTRRAVLSSRVSDLYYSLYRFL